MEINSVSLPHRARSRFPSVAWTMLAALVFRASPAEAQGTVDAGVTGFDVKRPVLASACPNGCPWGELGDFVKEAMQPYGYEVVLCRNCNRAEGPRIVANASVPPEIGIEDVVVGTTTRINAPSDFGITSSRNLAWAYAGLQTYREDGPYPTLRLIAKIEDPSYLLLAVKAESGITDLSQVAERQLPVVILGGGSPVSQPILDHYGLTEAAVTSWGGVFRNPTIYGQADAPEFDVVITENGSPANNPEAAYWTKVSQQHALRFLDLPEQVLDGLAGDPTLGLERTVVKWGLLRGVDRPIPTVARSGHVVFSRDDMPEQAAYDAAKAIDEHRGALRWYIRPYSYDPRTVWQNMDVPLHPGAARYYREAGYMPGAATDGACSEPRAAASPSGACAFRGGGRSAQGSFASVAPLVALLAARGRRRMQVTTETSGVK